MRMPTTLTDAHRMHTLRMPTTLTDEDQDEEKGYGGTSHPNSAPFVMRHQAVEEGP